MIHKSQHAHTHTPNKSFGQRKKNNNTKHKLKPKPKTARTQKVPCPNGTELVQTFSWRLRTLYVQHPRLQVSCRPMHAQRCSEELALPSQYDRQLNRKKN